MEISPYEDNRAWPAIDSDGKFSFSTRLKKFYILARPRKDYAITFFGPYKFAPGQTVTDLTLKLKRGFTSSVKFLDQNGRPIPNVQLTGGFPEPPDYSSWRHTIKSESDEQGVAAIQHTTDSPANLTCEAPGYIKDSRHKIDLSPDKPYTWQLNPAPTTQITVLSKKTGQPIPDAAVLLYGDEYQQMGNYYIDRPKWTTNETGLFELKTLAPGEQYRVLLYHPDYQRRYVDITAGDKVTAKLNDFQSITGKLQVI
ncbi:hypothetical protein STSP2_03187 [Anaerohalosphaera lusitana]|uniref:Carboxypeptidase regulatory-like domain-containing protein n=1 Tax=Anaerohalosphaera lusitana TaxID=1936003 RepID=A0A1U9NR37_9BACT|nr:carboxypeptidase-like regulatory domain-containing protein [Anaerohalosphaera lusitana]AQT69986.1 hypothetical protein STSP2_03187 [Anaerohalosphaera lusitana]